MLYQSKKQFTKLIGYNEIWSQTTKIVDAFSVKAIQHIKYNLAD
jgi:hypothetical protein